LDGLFSEWRERFPEAGAGRGKVDNSSLNPPIRWGPRACGLRGPTFLEMTPISSLVEPKLFKFMFDEDDLGP